MVSFAHFLMPAERDEQRMEVCVVMESRRSAMSANSRRRVGTFRFDHDPTRIVRQGDNTEHRRLP